MADLLLYSMKSAFVLILLYVPYVLLLRRETFFAFNRAVLLGMLLLSLVLPLCNIPWLSLDGQPVVQAAQQQLISLGVPIATMLPEVEVPAARRAAENGLSLFMLLSIVYMAGVACVLLVRVSQLVRLHRGVRRGNLWCQEQDGVRIHCLAGDVAPFSWMRNVVISEADFRESGREILLHEMGHIRAHHSWDVLLLGAVEMVQWWNPLVYLLGISLRDVHEYEADDYVLRQGVSAQGYQLLVIKKAVGSGSYAFANSFNHSLTKKRITMMCKKNKSKAWMRARALYVIPAAALALSAFATPKFVAPIEGAVSKLGGKVTENTSVLQASEANNKPLAVEAAKEAKEDSVFNVVAVNAEYPEGWDACMKFMSESIRYPQLCQEFGVQGRVILKFVVEKDGRITHIEKVRGPGKRLTQADVDAYRKENPASTLQPKAGDDLGELLFEEGKRTVEAMPRWVPARNEQGEPVRSRFYLPIVFKLN